MDEHSGIIIWRDPRTGEESEFAKKRIFSRLAIYYATTRFPVGLFSLHTGLFQDPKVEPPADFAECLKDPLFKELCIRSNARRFCNSSRADYMDPIPFTDLYHRGLSGNLSELENCLALRIPSYGREWFFEHQSCVALALNTLRISSVIDPFGSLVTNTKYLSGEIDYYTISQDDDLCIVNKALSSIYNRENNQILKSFDGERRDAVVLYYDDSNEPCHLIDEVLEEGKKYATKYVILVPARERARRGNSRLYEFLNLDYYKSGEEYEPLANRLGILKGGHLVGLAVESDLNYFVYVFDLEGGHKEVRCRYNRLGFSPDCSVVDYSDLYTEGAPAVYDWNGEESCDVDFDPHRFFCPNAEKGESVIRLGDIVEVVNNGYRHVYDTSFPTFDFMSRFDEVASPLMNKPRKRYYDDVIPWEGNNIHFQRKQSRWRDGLRVCISRTSGKYALSSEPDFTVRLKNDAKVLPEYLAYVLMKNRLFCESFDSLKNKGNFLLALNLDQDVQKRIVEKAIEDCRDVVVSDGEYTALVIGEADLFSEEDKENISSWRVNLKESTVQDLIAMPEDRLRPGVVDAIIFDPRVDSGKTGYRELRRILPKCMGAKIPLFVYEVNAPSPGKELKTVLNDFIFPEEMDYFRDNIYNAAREDNAVKQLFAELRNTLDRNGTLGARLRTTYKREFEAADIVSGLFGGNYAEGLEKLLTNRTVEQLKLFREEVESVLKGITKILSHGSGLEDINAGIIPDLFSGAVIKDAGDRKKKSYGKIYWLEGKIMEKTLAVSLAYMYQILNGVNHTAADEKGRELNVSSYMSSVRTGNLVSAVASIYMDFLVWLAGTGGEFDVVCDFRDAAKIRIGTLGRGSSNEWFVQTEADGQEEETLVHVDGVRNLQEGMKVELGELYPEKNVEYSTQYKLYTKSVRLLEN